MADKPKKLNPKQKKFAFFFAESGNATDAAIKAGYSEKTAQSQGSTLLSNPMVKAEVERVHNKTTSNIQRRTQVTREAILVELMAIGFLDFKELAEWDKDTLTFKPSKDLPERVTRAIKSIRTRESESQHGYSKQMDVVTHDKLKALELIAKLMGWMVEKHEHTGPQGDPLNKVDEARLAAEITKRLKGKKGRKFI